MKRIFLIPLTIIYFQLAQAQQAFTDKDGLVVIEAEHYTSQKGGWEEVEGRNALTPDITGIGKQRSDMVIVSSSKPDFAVFSNQLRISDETFNTPFAYSLPSADNVLSLQHKKPRAVVFLYEKGDQLAGMKAPAKRAGAYTGNTKLNDAGWQVLVKTASWAAGDGKDILFVAGDANPGEADATYIKKLKDAGFTVAISADENFDPNNAKNFDAIVISESVSTEHLHGKVEDLAVPVVVAEPHVYQQMGLIKTLQPWQPAPGQSGNAVLSRNAGEDTYLQYAVNFNKPGSYNLWLLAQGSGESQLDEVKVLLKSEDGSEVGEAKKIVLEDTLIWHNQNTEGEPIKVEIPSAGWYNVLLAKQANASQEVSQYPAWRVDKIILSQEEIAPKGDFSSETLAQQDVPKNMVLNQPFLPSQVWQETDGYIVCETEAIDHHPHWQLKKSPEGYSGDGYLLWQGPNYTRSIEDLGGNDDYIFVRQGPREGWLIIRVMVENPGTYRLDVRNIHNREDGDNDAWITYLGYRPDAENPIKRLGDSHKDGKGFTWLDWGIRPFELKKGMNELYIGGRSIGFGVDRVALYLEEDEQAKSKALDLNTPQSAMVE